MKAYIATKFENKLEFEKMAFYLKSQGHTITLDWTKHDAKSVPEELRKEYMKQCACECFVGVMLADVVIFIVDNRPMAGAFVEFGIALGLFKKIIIVNAFKGDGRQECIFFHLPSVEGAITYANSIEEASDLISPAVIPSNN